MMGASPLKPTDAEGGEASTSENFAYPHISPCRGSSQTPHEAKALHLMEGILDDFP